MMDTNTGQTIGLLEAVIIINELCEGKEEFKKQVRRIQEAIKKGVTDTTQLADNT